MNREIKFRVWDTKKCCFVPAGEVVLKFYDEQSIVVTPNCEEYVGDPVHSNESEQSRFALQQFTGLKDKDGREIYEGDIVKAILSGFEITGEIVWSKQACQYWIVWKQPESRYKELTANYGDDTQLVADYLEVIGNIYQNPNLLQQ